MSQGMHAFYTFVSLTMRSHTLAHCLPLSLCADPDSKVDYMHCSKGLFPAPLARNAKAAHVNKVKAKFKFLGKFMAKALMDSRMVSEMLALLVSSSVLFYSVWI